MQFKIILLSLLFLFKYMVGMCVCRRVVWSSKNSFVELALSFHLLMGSESQIQAMRFVKQMHLSLKSSLFPLGSLSQYSITVKRHQDHSNSYKRNHLIGDLFSVSGT